MKARILSTLFAITIPSTALLQAETLDVDTNSHSSVRCTDPVAQTIREDGDIYTFEVVTTCKTRKGSDTLKIQSEHYKALKETAKNRMGDMSESFTYIAPTYRTKNGSISIRFLSSLNKTARSVTYHAISDNISATSYAKNTQSVIIHAEYTSSSQQTEVEIKKTAKIERPGMDFLGLFEGKAKKGLEKEFEKEIIPFYSKILGSL